MNKCATTLFKHDSIPKMMSHMRSSVTYLVFMCYNCQCQTWQISTFKTHLEQLKVHLYARQANSLELLETINPPCRLWFQIITTHIHIHFYIFKIIQISLGRCLDPTSDVNPKKGTGDAANSWTERQRTSASPSSLFGCAPLPSE